LLVITGVKEKFTLYKVFELRNKKLPIKYSEEYYTSSCDFISNIAKEILKPTIA
jgi:hypothetical protein